MKTTITDQVDERIRAAVLAGLKAHNDQHANGEPKEFSIGIDHDGAIVGGALGRSQWDWVFVALLWVDASHRGTGLGTGLMRGIHDLALARGCVGIHLDTFSFQARGFYEKLGFQVFGVVEDQPVGHRRFYLSKRIA